MIYTIRVASRDTEDDLHAVESAENDLHDEESVQRTDTITNHQYTLHPS